MAALLVVEAEASLLSYWFDNADMSDIVLYMPQLESTFLAKKPPAWLPASFLWCRSMPHVEFEVCCYSKQLEQPNG